MKTYPKERYRRLIVLLIAIPLLSTACFQQTFRNQSETYQNLSASKTVTPEADFNSSSLVDINTPVTMVTPQPADNPTVVLNDREKKVIELINQEREKRGLHPLSIDSRIVSSARLHSKNMAEYNFFSHDGLNGESIREKLTAQGYKPKAASENIYAGPDYFNTPEQAVQHWMNSETHRQSILNEVYTEIGVGYAYNEESKYKGYYTVQFANPE